MPVRNDIHTADRAVQSAFDRRAISVASHLLMGGVWMERQLTLAPKRLGSLLGGPQLSTERSTMVQPGEAAL
jgi:hypothetical protein